MPHSLAPTDGRDPLKWWRDLRVFLLVTFAVTWLLWTPLALSGFHGDVLPWNYYLASAGPLVGGVVVLWLFTFGVGEEAGWRGWLMPHVMQRTGFFASAFIVTGIWLIWHAPAFLFNPSYTAMGFGIVGWAIALLAGSIWLGWLSRLAGWSVLPVVAWHGGFDLVTTSDLLPATIPATVSAIVMVQVAVVTAVVIIRTRQMRRSR